MATTSWDHYADFYDWENARTIGRRDVAFWRRFVAGVTSPIVELGCGTGRLLIPLARQKARAVGVDLSWPMLERARERTDKLPRSRRPTLIHGDIRALPFGGATCGAVIAAYGVLQSLLKKQDLDATLGESARILQRGGLLGLDLVPDVPTWAEYRRQVRFRGRGPRGGELTLVESVRQDRRRGLTFFDEEFAERRGRRTERRKFTLAFRTISMDELLETLRRHRFKTESVSGDYRGGAWSQESDAWVVVAKKVGV